MKWTKGLAGALLAVALCLSLAAPALAVPTVPLTFAGDVTIGGANAPIGTGITAEIESTQVASATTTMVGRYAISVPYDASYIGKTVVLKVNGAVGGQGTYVNPETTPLVTVNLVVAQQYTLTMAVSGSGTTTPAVGDHPYAGGTVVDITATPAGGWQFDSWTGAVAAPTSATTTVTMNADKTVTANFSEITGIQKLIGADDAPGGNQGSNNFILRRYQAVATGNMAEFRVKCGVNGNVKVAIYADNSGEPGALITAMNTGQAVTAGAWRTLTFTSTNIVSGTYYWLAFNMDTTGAIQYISGTSGTALCKAATYSTFTFPDPAGSGFVYGASSNEIAGWGVIVVPTPPAPPTVSACKTSIEFEWDASAGATKYWLQVSTDPGFGAGTIVFEDDEITTTSQIVWLCFGNTYYWHVGAGNAAGWSGWTSGTDIVL